MREQGNCVQRVEKPGCFSLHHHTDLTGPQHLVLYREHQYAIDKCLNKIFADDRIPLNSKTMPINGFQRHGGLTQHCRHAFNHTDDLCALCPKVDEHRVKVLRIPQGKHESTRTGHSIG